MRGGALISEKLGKMGKHRLQEELESLVREDGTIFEFLQAGSLDGIWYWDLENPEQEWMSERFWELLGVQPWEKKHLASEWQDLIFHEDLLVATKNFERHRDDPSHPYDQLVRYRHSTGRTVWVRCRGIAIRDSEGKPIRLLGAHTDVTALKEAEQNLLRRTQELERANEELRDLVRSNSDLERFSYSVSHGLNEPLRTIDGFLQLLEQEASDSLNDSHQGFLQFARQGATELRRKVDVLLNMSRLTQHGAAMQRVELSQALALAQSAIEGRKLARSVRVVSGPLPAVLGNLTQLNQVFQQLLDNSLKFSSAGCDEIEVKVSAEVKGNMVRVSVQDQGPGFPPTQSESIFDLFRQGRASADTEGEGVGLAIVKQIVRRHGGTVHAVSAQGAGTEVSFTLEAAGTPSGESPTRRLS